MVLSWKSSLVWNIACLYGVSSILVGKWRATVVQRCKITCDMCYSLMVAQHRHSKERIILRPSKFVQHCCELTQRFAMLCECSWHTMQQFESPRVASEFWTCSKVRGDLMRPFSHMKQMRCIVQRKRQDVRIAKFTIAKCYKAVRSQLWKGYKINQNKAVLPWGS